MIDLLYGRVPYLSKVDGARVVEPCATPAPGVLPVMTDEALAGPLGAGPHYRLVSSTSRIPIIVADAALRAFLEARACRLRSTRLPLAIATSADSPSALTPLELPALPDDLGRSAQLIDGDGHADLVDLRVRPRETSVRVHCRVVEAAIVAPDCIRPLDVAGAGAGAPALFPAFGEEAAAIRLDHCRAEPVAHPRIFDRAPRRDDLQEAALPVPAATVLVDRVPSLAVTVHATIAGDLVPAFRAGAARAPACFRVRAVPTPQLVASDVLHESTTLRSTKIAAPVPLIGPGPGGTLAVDAECGDRGAPLVVDANFRIAGLPRLGPGVPLKLGGSPQRDTVAPGLSCDVAAARALPSYYHNAALLASHARAPLFEVAS